MRIDKIVHVFARDRKIYYYEHMKTYILFEILTLLTSCFGLLLHIFRHLCLP